MNENAAMIRDFVSCKAEALKEVAERHKVSLPSAKEIRDHWIPRLSGRCVKCNGFVKKGKCSKCGAPVSSVEDTLEVLSKIKPATPLIRRRCWKCKNSFMYRAGFVLEKIKEHGAFVPASMCSNCKKQEQEKKELEKEERLRIAEEKKKATKKTTKKKVAKREKIEVIREGKKAPESPQSQDVKNYGTELPDGLKHSPFKQLKVLKVQKQ